MGVRQIARRLRVSINTVRRIIQQEGVMPQIERSDKQRIDPELLRELYEQCDGRVQGVHEKLVEEQGIAVKYSTLTRMVRELGIGKSREARLESSTSSEYWFTEILKGARPDDRLNAKLHGWKDLNRLLEHIKHGRARQRKKAATIIGRQLGISNAFVAKALHSSRMTTRRYFRIYSEAGADYLFVWNTSRKFTDGARDSARTKRVLELLHNKPASYGINRTSWTQPSLLKAYEQTFGGRISRSTFTRLLRSTRYRWRKARKVLTSPDPRYHEKLVPLPTSAQFLNVIEGVLSAMTKAVINNSDYPSPLEMKRAISTHFNERNDYFKTDL